jgi:hypothetical protein
MLRSGERWWPKGITLGNIDWSGAISQNINWRCAFAGAIWDRQHVCAMRLQHTTARVSNHVILSSGTSSVFPGMNHVAGDILNRVVSARELPSCIQTAVSENRTVHSALSKHNLWLQDAARDWICASGPALVMLHTESQGYEQIQRVEFQAQCEENKC